MTYSNVTVIAYTGVRRVFATLEDAVLYVGKDAIDRLRSGRLAYSFCWDRQHGKWPNDLAHPFGGDQYQFVDDLDLVIPNWKVREAYYNLPVERRARKRPRWIRYYGYKFRDGPVPNCGSKRKHSGYYRKIRTTNEIRSNCAVEADNDDCEIQIKVRRNHLPTMWDDPMFSCRGDGWKNYRKTQYK